MQSFFDMEKGEYEIMTNMTKYEMETVINLAESNRASTPVPDTHIIPGRNAGPVYSIVFL